MASIAGNGNGNFKFDAGSVLPHDAGNVGTYNPAEYVTSKIGGKRRGKQQKGGSLAFSHLHLFSFKTPILYENS